MMTKLQGKTRNAVIGAMLAIALLAAAFWMLLLSPKRDEADKLAKQVKRVERSLRNHEAEIELAEEARRDFPEDYQRLVVLGKAVPGDDDTASLLVQVNGIADSSRVRFETLQLSTSSGSGGEAPPAPSGTTVSATEAAASLMPLGAAIGPAGLAVMPYTLTFTGNFFTIADFIKGLDSLVETTNEKVAVDGRLITVDGFSLGAAPDSEFPDLQANFSVTTYLTPPGEGITAGASPGGPPPSTATPAALNTGGAP